MDVMTGWVMMAVLGAAIAVYAIYKGAEGAADERQIKHKEFEARLQPEHQEAMAKVMATRDAEIAKATKKEPAPVIGLKPIESVEIKAGLAEPAEG